MKKTATTSAIKLATIAAAITLAMAARVAQSDVTDLASAPLFQTSSTQVLPNLFLTVDTSGSMGWDFVPDNVNPDTSGSGGTPCKPNTSTSSCNEGDPPFYASVFNGVSYNPQITYTPGLNYDGSSRGSKTSAATSAWTAVPVDSYQTSGTVNGSPSGTINLITSFPENQYCDNSGSNCRSNGIDTAGGLGVPFTYRIGQPASVDIGVNYGFPDSASTVIPVVTYNFGYSITKSNGTKNATVTVKSGTGPAAGTTLSIACNGGNSNLTSTSPSTFILSYASGTGAVNSTFIYKTNTNSAFSNITSCNSSGSPFTTPSTTSGPFNNQNTINGPPFYFVITPIEYCSEAQLVNCVASTVATGIYTFPAYVRWCTTSALANAPPPVSGKSGSPLVASCNNKTFTASTVSYTYARFGQFTRTNIVSGTTTYGGRPLRADCAAAPTCTYTEEMTNFANWYTYYRTRIQMMKTSLGLAFAPIGSTYRVGFITINPGSPVSSSKYLGIGQFVGTQKQNWYSTVYAQSVGNSTPLREALSRAGRYYAHKTNGINSGMNDDPIQYSCQQNFTLLTTDGYWNTNGDNSNNDGVQLDGTTAIGNQDNVDNTGAMPPYSSRATGTYDGGCAAGTYNAGGCANTLADVAMYYYSTDLRSTGSIGALGTDVSLDNVPTNPNDTNPTQHMVTFTLGLADGLMTYKSKYDTSTTGDFALIKQGASGACFWTSGICNWPTPLHDTPSALDDLWHAAVNGRGKYFHAQDPSSLSSGLQGALASLQVQLGSASAAATSSPNITQTNNFIFSSTFDTVQWTGDVQAQQIDASTGNVVPAILWSAQAQLDTLANATTPGGTSRVIYTFDSTQPNKLNTFQWANLTVAEQTLLLGSGNINCSGWTQWTSLSVVQQTAACTGANLVAFLRGDSTNSPALYRQRVHVLGDTVNATPAYVQAPSFAFGDAVTPSYATFQAANASRQGVIYIGANDGMLHAFNGTTGVEMWAYVPKQLIGGLAGLADNNWSTLHKYLVDGSPQIMDVFDSVNSAWKTILVGGLNHGGQGFYALDITNPSTPIALWEICSNSALCAISDADMGYSYGNAVTAKRLFDGKWVVMLTSGYDNVPPSPAAATGHGFLYVLDALSGTLLRKVDTGVGGLTTGTCPAGFSPAYTAPCPSGLAKISAWADNFSVDNTAKWVYGGDLMGNVWRFNMAVDPPAVQQLATLRDASGKPQSITTRPELGDILGNRVLFVGTGRYLGVTDLSNPSTIPLPYAYANSLYAFRDNGTNNGNLRTSNPPMVQQTITQPTTTSRTISTTAVDWTGNLGWFVDFNPGIAPGLSPGERVTLDPQLVLGTLVVATNVPLASACTSGGDSWFYQFNYYNGSYIATSPLNVVATKLTGSILVGNVVIRLPSGAVKAVSTESSGTKLTQGINTSGTGGTGRRISWRELVQ